MNPQMQENNPQTQPPQAGLPTSQQPMQDFSSAPSPEQKANKAGANLGFINTLQQHLLQYKAKQNAPKTAPQTPETAPKTDETAKTEEDTNKPDLAKELTSFKTEIEGMIKSQIGDLKREIELALNDNEEPKAQENS